MPKLITAILCRNEADKYLERVLTRCLEFSDKVCVLDDGSTDGSDRMAWGLGCDIRSRKETGMWGNESPARAELWDWGAKEAGDGWLLICDADMILVGDPRPLLLTTQHNAWSFVLFDLWDSESTYRLDGFWRGHEFPRPWLFKPSALGYDTPIWPDRGIHCGHSPVNAILNSGICDPSRLAWMHLAYMEQPNRLRKHQQYLAKADQLSPFETAHATSILDPYDGAVGDSSARDEAPSDSGDESP